MSKPSYVVYPAKVANHIVREQRKEIEELKAKLEMYENGVYYSSENDKLQEEIERLNNIINELEKFICDLEIECNIDNSMWGVAVIIHNKLKELKGDSSNE
jgi:predicted RNase H-like nuclease (RuvC/YqgF family)